MFQNCVGARRPPKVNIYIWESFEIKLQLPSSIGSQSGSKSKGI